MTARNADNLRETASSRKADRERNERLQRRELIKSDPLAAKIAATGNRGARVKRGTFFEEEPVLTDFVPQPGPTRSRKLPAPAEHDVVRATVVGSRAALIPTGPLSAMALAAARAEFDFKVDAKRRQRLYFFDRVLRRGAINWENMLALLRVKGVQVEIDPNAEHLVARYRAHLERQMAPLARSVWRDEEKDYTPVEEFE